MSRTFLRALLFVGAASMASSCTGCDDSATAPSAEDDASFQVDFANVSATTTLYYQSFAGSTPVYNPLTPGDDAPQRPVYTGSNGSSFSFSVYNATGTQILMTATCTLTNADRVLVFQRLVKFDIDGGKYHCEGW